MLFVINGSSFEGQWQNGRRHGLGVETRGRWIYRGEWTSGSKGRYGVRQSATSTAKYEGTWAGGLQDGYGSETYADGGSYQGQWQGGKRHGYGVRTSAPFGLASHYRPKTIQTSMTSLRSNDGGSTDPAERRNHRMDEVRGGFVLKAKSDEPPARRNSLVEKTKKGLLSGLKLKKQRSTGDLEKRGTVASGSIRSTVSTASWISTGSSQSAMSNKSAHTDSNASFTVDEEQLDPSITETYMGEWKRDKRDGYGISERSDGLKYEGEWHNNKKHGYGVTTFRDGTKEEGKYKCNVLITSQKKKHLFLIRSAKFRERIEGAVSSSQRASKYALQKADIAVSRMSTARGKAEMADSVADHAKLDSEVAVATAREFAPNFKPSVLNTFERIRARDRFRPPTDIDPTLKATAGGVNSPSHQIDNRQYGDVPSPQKPAIRRTSMLQKQPSMDYTTMTNINNTQSINISPYSTSSQQPQSSPFQYSQQQPPGSNYGNSNLSPNPMPKQPSNSIYNTNYSSNVQHPQLTKQQTIDQDYGEYSGQHANDYGSYQTNYNNQSLDLNQQQGDMRRNSRHPNDSNRPMLGSINQSSIDHYDHYKRAPSRDSSVDRYARAASRLGGGSRQTSIDRSVAGSNTVPDTPDRGVRAGSAFRTITPVTTSNGAVLTGTGTSRSTTPVYQMSSSQAVYSNPNQPFEDVLLRQRTLGQDIIPSPREPKRTESLYLPPKSVPTLGGGIEGNGGGKSKLKQEINNLNNRKKFNVRL
ncbi:Junctophilin-3 [Pseudolycoriella hygida]|uniref:Junctophilin-3 n=1 Tax=Pseudolycoriella hygida TaxID=35572 RepID=A0A9Q0NDS2_9DIPT|nr:Junctophilin-3 [Pseudolycoriella hygida]